LGSLRFHYEVSGAGPSLVLIPGWTLNTHLWDLLVPHLETHFTVLRYDPRGAGRSTCDPSLEYSRLSDAEDLSALLDSLGIEKAHIVGHSKGARIAFVFAMNRPERAVTTTGIGSAEPHPTGQEVPNFRPIAEAWVEKAKTVTAEGGPRAVVDYLSKARLFGKLRTSPEGLRILRSAMEGYAACDLLSETPKRTFDTDAGAARLTGRILYMAGEEDPFLPECRYAHARISNSLLEILPKCGHMAPLERPEAVAAALLKFLKNK
jgi:3-oxoadipate enol-lactonase